MFFIMKYIYDSCKIPSGTSEKDLTPLWHYFYMHQSTYIRDIFVSCLESDLSNSIWNIFVCTLYNMQKHLQLNCSFEYRFRQFTFVSKQNFGIPWRLNKNHRHFLEDLCNCRYDDLIFERSFTTFGNISTDHHSKLGILPPQFDNFNAGQEKAIEVRESRSRNDLGKLPNY